MIYNMHYLIYDKHFPDGIVQDCFCVLLRFADMTSNEVGGILDDDLEGM